MMMIIFMKSFHKFIDVFIFVCLVVFKQLRFRTKQVANYLWFYEPEQN